ncbi:MAG: malectin domain-containing carbohydrate-binding protein, partial [bacterium]
MTGVTGGVTYYFAIKSKDEAGNVSPISNVVTATTANSIVATDDFERTTLGQNWTAHPDIQIVNGELHNTNTSNILPPWDFMAVYNAKKNPISMQFKWGASADKPGIDEGGFALMLDAASTNANGYLLFRQASTGQIRLWTIENGAPGHSVASVVGQTGTPGSGDIFRVDLRSDANGHFFDLFINGVFDGTVSDPTKEQGNGTDLFAGFMLHNNLNNPVDDFALTTARGTASQLAIFSGNGQEASFGETLANPLVVQVLDDDNNPIPGETVKFQVTKGAGTIQSVNGATAIRVNLGGNAYTDVSGNNWLPDQAYSPGSFGYIGGDVDPIPKPIGNTQDDVIYQMERFGLTSYKADLPLGEYTIVMHFSEGTRNAPGLRVFSVNIEGAPVLINFDIFAETQARYVALKKTFTVTVTDGTLDIDFQQFVDKSLLNGIEILSSDEIGVSDANGQVARSFTLGSVAGLNEITVTPQSFTANPVVFSVTNLGGPASQIAIISGDGQSGTAGQQLAQPFVVEVRDIAGNPKPKYAVNFVVTRGGGTLSTQQPVLTDINGRATVAYILGNMSETNEVEAQASGLTGSPVVFTATSTSGVGTSLQTVSGNNQTGTVGNDLSSPLVVRVVDTNNQPVPNFPAGFYINRGGGTTSHNLPIINPDFEDGFHQTPLGMAANNWSDFSSANAQIHSQVAGEKPGKNAHRIDTRGINDSAGILQVFQSSLKHKGTFRTTIKYRAEGDSTKILRIRIRKQNISKMQHSEWTLPGTNNRWHEAHNDIV